MKKKILVLVSLVLAFSFFAIPQKSSAAGENAYDYDLVYQSPYPSTLTPGLITNVSIQLKNTGTETWYNSGDAVVRLASGSVFSNNKDYDSEFYNNDWLSPNRPAAISNSPVAPGETATINFNIKAPEAMGVYRAYFTPVVDGVTWMKDIGLYWEINVSRAFPYSFDYENPNDPINTEVNQNTSTVATTDQQLLFAALNNNLNYNDFSADSSFLLDFQLSDQFLAQNQSSIGDTSDYLTSLGITFDLSSQSKNEVILNFNNVDTAVGSNDNADEYLKTDISLNTKNSSGQTTSIFDGEVESIVANQTDVYLKINRFNLLNPYFTYAEPDTWYKSESTEAQPQLFTYDTSKNDAINYTQDYGNALARDLNRGGIAITNIGNEPIGGVNTTHLQILINADNAKKYYEILNEKSTLDQQSLSQQEAMIDQYLDGASIDVWIDPSAKIARKLSFNLNVKPNDYFTKLAFSTSFTFDSINDPSLTVNVPSTSEPIENLDLMQKLMDKFSPVDTMKVEVSAIRNEIGHKIHNGLEKIKQYLKNL